MASIIIFAFSLLRTNKIATDAFLKEDASSSTDAASMNNVERNTEQSLCADINTQTEDTAGCLQTDDSKGKDIDSVVTLVKILSDKTKLNNFTELHSFELLDALVECVSDLPVDKSNRKKDMILRNRILLTFSKLKQNLSFTSLIILFNISRQTCVNYFKSTISTLAVVLETMIP